jgi:hypothetical protein
MPVTLGDIVDNGNVIKEDWYKIFREFSNKPNKILICFIHEAIILEMREEEISYYLKDIENPEYDKKKDNITKIIIVDAFSKIPFSNIDKDYINKDILSEFKIPCDYISDHGHGKSDSVDLVEHWNKFDKNDLITIHGKLIPKE